MSKLSFRDLFKRDTLERAEADMVPPDETELDGDAAPVQGELFPDLDLDERLEEAPVATILFISLTCSSCIDLLCDLGKFGERHEGLLLLVSSGSGEDNAELVQYYNYPFRVLTMEEKVYKSRYGLEATPAAMLLEHGVVKKQFTIQDIHHLYEQSGVRRGGG